MDLGNKQSTAMPSSGGMWHVPDLLQEISLNQSLVAFAHRNSVDFGAWSSLFAFAASANTKAKSTAA